MIINTKLGVFPKTLRIYINLYYSKNTSMTLKTFEMFFAYKRNGVMFDFAFYFSFELIRAR